ncbi:hypothetical protein Q75_06655 [Bacillus coahuilensis p1.1.43]|uniref:Uncharacterized protein n=1 Tax=Bacillus coahuilensis p1.1.43 TaxID=1150625 RepID=A0A147K952_9BACI|nr:endospore germination permease [Bacillus coahuilensis]KUP06890.1 hypothetical protein Q75_06655 [Bacillus coahuilensis p1.1.43]
MKKITIISNSQFMILCLFFIMGSSVLFLPSILTNVAKQDAIFSVVLGSIFGCVLTYLYSIYAKQFHDQSYIDSIKHTFGIKIGLIFIWPTFIFYFFVCAVLLWDIGDFIVTQILPGTPIQSIYILFLIVVVYIVRLGVETTARTAEIFLPWILLLFLLLVLLSLPGIEMKNILPVFENGISPIMYGAYYMVGFPFLELIILLSFTPYVEKQKYLTRYFIMGVGLGSIVLIILTAYCVLILGPGITARSEFPIYSLGKKVSIGNFLERLEIFVAIIWFISIFFKLTLSFYALSLSVSTLFKIEDHRKVTTPLAFLVFMLTLILFPSSIFLKEFSQYASTPFMIVVGLIIPFITLMASRLKKRKKER